ncbi:AbiH family protein [Tenacibaculum discolor]|uniref:AbiH family protein n=1 Tax=Tenacibaculum discolor TaxID=361581 RepID=UPI0026891BE6|nr:AbiH family protein [Tenacibaculum discolor]
MRLNKEFSHVKILLKEYLSTIVVNKNKAVTTFFNLNFSGKQSVIVVNFNYTNTINQYLSDFFFSSSSFTREFRSVVYNYFIHGDLNSDLTFGYGDDDSEEYKLMKKTGRDEYLENFKTFHYLEDNNYRELISILEGLENYETYILGHSLSLTDKTLLYEILSPEKCYNIHLFYRLDISNEDKKRREIKKLHFNISRILNNDNDSRKKNNTIELSPHFTYKQSDNNIIQDKVDVIYESGAVDY